MLAVIMLANLVMMCFFIETRNENANAKESVVFTTETGNDTNADDDTDDISGNTPSVSPSPFEDDLNGMGYVYSLVELIYKANLPIMLMFVWIVDWLRWST